MKKKTKKTKENKQIIEIHIHIHQEGYQIPICPVQANPEPLPLSKQDVISREAVIKHIKPR